MILLTLHAASFYKASGAVLQFNVMRWCHWMHKPPCRTLASHFHLQRCHPPSLSSIVVILSLWGTYTTRAMYMCAYPSNRSTIIIITYLFWGDFSSTYTNSYVEIVRRWGNWTATRDANERTGAALSRRRTIPYNKINFYWWRHKRITPLR